MSSGSLFRMNRADRRVMLSLLALAALGLAIVLLTGESESRQPEATLPAQSDSSLSAETSPQPSDTSPRPASDGMLPPEKLFPFDPNTADSTALRSLGLSPFVVHSLLQYRRHGGVFMRKEDLARLHGLTAGEYRRLEPWISIAQSFQPAATLLASPKAGAGERPPKTDTIARKHKIALPQTVSLNTADTVLLQRVPGIGSYYAARIVQLRQRLGGFVSQKQLGEIDGFPMESTIFFHIDTAAVERLPINRLTVSELRRHPYINYYQARAIADFRRLHGPISDLSQLALSHDFPPEAIERLRPYIEY